MSRNRGGQVSGAAIGGVGFAGALLILIGGFQIIEGIAAISDDKFFRKPAHYALHVNPTTWGWIHLILGAAIVYTGISILRGANWAAVTGIVLAIFSAFIFFFAIPLYPFWAILIIALDVWVIWALSTPGALRGD
jgi:hypothetical protein